MEDLKKSVLIKGDNIIGFTGRGVLPITQEEFNALPPEKQLNGSYYITDGTDEIVISDNEVSENQLWSSQKIASELKTSENTDKTPIVYDAYVSSTTNESNFYIVRNGICYVYMDFTIAIDNPSGEGILLERIPKPIGVINCQVVLYNNSTIPQGMLTLNEEGAIIAEYNLKLDERYLCNFSYPIA